MKYTMNRTYVSLLFAYASGEISKGRILEILQCKGIELDEVMETLIEDGMHWARRLRVSRLKPNAKNTTDVEKSSKFQAVELSLKSEVEKEYGLAMKRCCENRPCGQCSNCLGFNPLDP